MSGSRNHRGSGAVTRRRVEASSSLHMAGRELTTKSVALAAAHREPAVRGATAQELLHHGLALREEGAGERLGDAEAHHAVDRLGLALADVHEVERARPHEVTAE